MCSTTTTLFKPSSMANGCINSLPSLFKAKTSYPFLSLPSKPIKFLHLTCSPSSWVSSRNRNSSSTVIAFVARTSDWARQEEGEVVEEEFNWENQQTDGSRAEDGDTVVEESEESYIEPPEEAKIFVGNLPYDMDSEKLAQLFDQAGLVEVSEVIYNRETDQSRGFGFLTMSTVEEAEKAVNMFNGYDVNGRLLTVNKAAPRGSRSERPPRMFEPSFKIYVGNLPWQVDDARLEQIFSVHGKVVDARVVYDRESGRSRGFGFITMSTQTEVDDAIAALDGQNLDGRAIRVNVAEQRPRRGSF